MQSVWNHLESRWPAVIGVQQRSYGALRQEMRDFLARCGVTDCTFSHYGVVVASIDASVASVCGSVDWRMKVPCKNRVEAYNVYVARTQVEGLELELIEPVGDSFFADFLKDHAEGLQHLAFRVSKIDTFLQTLRAKGEELVDRKPQAGSHGKVAFAKPRQFAPLYLELCQPG